MPAHKKFITWKENGECWECDMFTSPTNRYPRTFEAGKLIQVSRFIYQECFGEVPEGMKLLHKCDNPKCINPEHLFLGTLSDNVQDCIKKGRHRTAKGEKHPMSKLIDTQRNEIILSKSSYSTLAKEYNVSKTLIYHIKRKVKLTN